MIRFGFMLFLLLLNALWVTLLAYQWLASDVPSSETQTLDFQRCLLDLQSVDLKCNNGTSMRFEKATSKWCMTAPIDWEAHPLVMDRFLQVLLRLKPKFVLKSDSAADLSKYGFDPPLGTLTLQTAAEVYQLTIGQALDKGKEAHLFVPETREVFSVDGELASFLGIPLERWCFPYLWDFKELKTIALESPQQKVLLDKTEPTWSLRLPFSIPIDTQKADALSQQLRHLKIERFLTAEEEQTYRCVFSDTHHMFRLTLGDGQTTETLQVLPTDTEPHAYIAQHNGEGTLFWIKTDAIDRLLHAPETLCERILFDLELSKIRQITCHQDGLQTILRPLDKNEWERSIHAGTADAAIQTQKVPVSRLQSLTDTLNMLRVKDFLPNEPNIADKTRVDLEITTLDNTLSATVYCSNDTAYAKLSNRPSWVRLTSFDPNAFQAYFEFTEDKTVWKFGSAERIVRIGLKSPFKEAIEVLSPADYKGAPLAHLTADRWLKDDDLPTFQTDIYTLFITTENDSYIQKTYELTFSERIGGRLQIGGYAEKKFTFTSEWMDFLFRITHSKERENVLRTFLNP